NYSKGAVLHRCADARRALSTDRPAQKTARQAMPVRRAAGATQIGNEDTRVKTCRPCCDECPKAAKRQNVCGSRLAFLTGDAGIELRNQLLPACAYQRRLLQTCGKRCLCTA